MSSSNSELEKISTQMNNLALQKQQLLERNKVLCFHEELRNRLNQQHTEESAHSQQEIDHIGEKLKQLSTKKTELQETFDNLCSAEDTKKEKEVVVEVGEETGAGVPGSGMNVFHVETPKIPDFPLSEPQISMSSSNSELEKISTQLDKLALQKQQLLERNKVLCFHEELRNRLNLQHTEKSAHSQQEIDHIGEKLKQLSAKKTELKKTFDNLCSAEDTKKEKEVVVEVDEEQEADAGVPGSGMNVFHVETPEIPAPAEVVDVENLPRRPCRSQCPECGQVILTETSASVSTDTWLLCVSAAAIGCVAGCCLIPFCFDRFKSVTHNCPMCRTSIKTTSWF
uniref:LITAF domain-containing protein n=1 Tax=Salarias fasciatus TaxID=181472 RepID=A0A672FEE1_SALFA